jgi:putative membrane protein
MFAAASAAHTRRMSAEQREERRFLKDAAAAARFQSEASRMALARAGDPGVRAFATTLIQHHASAGPALQSMLHGRGMAPPMLGNGQRKTLNRLARLNGRKFDSEYMQEVGLKHQQEDLRSYDQAAATALDPALKAWIARTLPTLRHHLATAERVAAPQARLAAAPASRAAPARQAAHSKTQPPPVSGHSLEARFMSARPAELGTAPAATAPNGQRSR